MKRSIRSLLSGCLSMTMVFSLLMPLSVYAEQVPDETKSASAAQSVEPTVSIDATEDVAATDPEAAETEGNQLLSRIFLFCNGCI